MRKIKSVLNACFGNGSAGKGNRFAFLPGFAGVVLALLVFPHYSAAQQAAQSSLAMFNPFQWNPGFAGVQGKTTASLGARLQWAGLEGAPATQVASFHAPFEILGGGLGLKLENDAFGATQSLRAVVAYNYHIPIGEGVLGVGLGTGMVRRMLDGNLLRTPEGTYSDNFSDHRDALLTVGRMQGTAPIFEAGLYYQGTRLEAGFSMANLNSPGIGMGTFNWSETPAFFANVALHLGLSQNFSAHPALWVRGDGIQVQTDLGLIFQYKENISAGASLRGYDSKSLDAIAFIAGFQISEKLRLGYAWDWTLSPLQQVSNGSHEVLLTYALPKVLGRLRLPPILYNPRNL